MPPSPLERLAAAVEARKRAEADALAAMIDARRQGATLADIADAAGLSRPGVLKILRREGEA